MKLSDLITGIATLDSGYTHDLFGPDPLDLEIESLAVDSRRVGRNTLFIAVTGTAVDGRLFIPAALEAGAIAILTNEPPADRFDHVPVLIAPDIRRAVALLAARFFGEQPEVITAVTGTNGKTSTAVFTAALWDSLGHPSASLGTLGLMGRTWSKPGSLTTPDPLTLNSVLAEAAHHNITHLCLEASSHGLDQGRLAGTLVKAAAFTNLTRDHLDYHGSEETYFAAKCRLFTEILSPDGTAVINADTPYSERLVREIAATGRQVWTFGKEGQQIKLLNSTPYGSGQTLELEVFGRHTVVELPLVGCFQAANALAALGLVIATGGDHDQAVTALGHLEGVPGRIECVGQRSSGGRRSSGGAVYVDYAHTPDALKTVLTALRPHTGRHLICVFGAGGDRDRGKRPLMGAVAARLADRVIVTDDNPRSEDPATIRADVLAGAPKAEEIADRRTAIRAAIASAGPGDVVLIAGKGHETGQIVGTVVHPFDDRQEASLALGLEQAKRASSVLWQAPDIARAVNAASTAPWTASGVSIDSRTVNRGDLFVALVGPNHDGHRHVGQALDAGAAGAIIHSPVEGLDGDNRLIQVNNTFTALEDLGRAARRRFKGRVIGVTGSVGKTSTKEMLALALGSLSPTHAAVGSLNNQWGVPLTLARMPANALYAVIEMGMNHAGEISNLAAMAQPNVAVITTIAPAHMEYFSSLTAIADAKAEIFAGTVHGGTAILPRDSNQYLHLAAAAQDAGLIVLSFGQHQEADVRLISAVIGENRTEIVARLPDGSGLSYEIAAVGQHWAINSLIALAVAIAVGVDPEAVAAALAGMTPPKGRGQRHRVMVKNGSFLVIDDAYNANTESIRAGLAVLAATSPSVAPNGSSGRRIVALGDMLELGPQGPALHAELATDVVARGIDLVYTAGPLMEHLREALPAERRGSHYASSDLLAEALKIDVRPGDVVLVKGSAGSRMGRVVDALLSLAILDPTGSSPPHSSTPQ